VSARGVKQTCLETLLVFGCRGDYLGELGGWRLIVAVGDVDDRRLDRAERNYLEL